MITAAPSSAARIRRSTSRPDIPGSITSRMTTDGFHCCQTSTAATPSATTRASYPALVRYAETTLDTVGSSSTTSTRVATVRA
jgi:hypothetical protein